VDPFVCSLPISIRCGDDDADESNIESQNDGQGTVVDTNEQQEGTGNDEGNDDEEQVEVEQPISIPVLLALSDGVTVVSPIGSSHGVRLWEFL
jgi:hypothetical protein